jgi:hypothetical protein
VLCVCVRVVSVVAALVRADDAGRCAVIDPDHGVVIRIVGLQHGCRSAWSWHLSKAEVFLLWFAC